MTENIIGPHYRDDDGAWAEFDQLHALALDLLRGAESFFLVVRNKDGSLDDLAGIRQEVASAFLSFAAGRAEDLAANAEDQEPDLREGDDAGADG